MAKSIIGLKRGTVKLVKYNPEWKKSFEREKKKLKDVLGDLVIDIQHVGSTAIPNGISKPVIDIGVIVKSLERVNNHLKSLENIGYVLKKENRSDRLFFTKGPEEKRTHYLHIGEKGSGYIEDMITFRDYLKKHKKIAQNYSELKKQLAIKYKDKRDLYTAKKEKFIKEIIKIYGKKKAHNVTSLFSALE